MATVLDVARYILRKQGDLDAMKLQKLCFYSQAWHLVWESKPLFQDRIEAWANGPVCPVLYGYHRGCFDVTESQFAPGDPDRLTASERDAIDRVLAFYGSKSGFWLSQVTHQEPPWKDARRGLEPGERGREEITHAAMAEYYGSLV